MTNGKFEQMLDAIRDIYNASKVLLTQILGMLLIAAGTNGIGHIVVTWEKLNDAGGAIGVALLAISLGLCVAIKTSKKTSQTVELLSATIALVLCVAVFLLAGAWVYAGLNFVSALLFGFRAFLKQKTETLTAT